MHISLGKMITVTRHCLSNESGDLKSILFFMIQRFPNFICLNLHVLQNLQNLQATTYKTDKTYNNCKYAVTSCLG